jgi:hypothetical protein
MNVEQLATIVIDACEAEGIGHMLTGAFAASFYGVPRSTSDVDLVVDLEKPEFFAAIATRLSEHVAFDPQIQFDTLTWGRRHVGATTTDPPFLVEVFELFDDPFVREQFSRRQRVVSKTLGRTSWLPTPEDLIIQKLRWGRPKDLDDARDVLLVQGRTNLDQDRITAWCAQHGTTAAFQSIVHAADQID